MKAVTWRIFAGLATGLLAASVARATDYCREREVPARSTTTIKLDAITRGVYQKPAFYVYDWSRRIQFFFIPEDVVAHFEEQLRKFSAVDPARARLPADDWLDWIRKDLPLKENTDLYKYGLRSYLFASNLNSLVADLLDTGHVAVDFWPIHTADSRGLGDEHDPKFIKRVYWADRNSAGRMYCNPDDVEILFILEMIVN